MGGAMGGVLGPAKALFHELAQQLPTEGMGVMRVGYRQPNNADLCFVDIAAAAESAVKVGAKRFLFLGHSFGGAIAIQAALAMKPATVGVGVFATQSAGCEGAENLGGMPFVLYHGDNDRILPYQSSQMVQMLAGYGDVQIMPGADHLLAEAADEIRTHLYPWIRTCFAES
jgi:pimeloyl-ACP methyl ester carboxylesterase